MGEALARLASLLLAVTFLWAGIAKLISFGAWRDALRGFGLAPALERPVSLTVPAVELSVAVIAILGDPQVAGALALALVAAFSLAILAARSKQGDRLPCGCFGDRGERDFRLLLGRNALLTVLVVAILLGPEEPLLSARRASWSDLLPAALVAVGLIMLVWMLFRSATLLRNRQY